MNTTQETYLSLTFGLKNGKSMAQTVNGIKDNVDATAVNQYADAVVRGDFYMVTRKDGETTGVRSLKKAAKVTKTSTLLVGDDDGNAAA